ncbi:MAG: hypothetical protein K5787_09790 [Lentisphaeria bacterium]|nr:hypothetical protein [Lentisphaeria bacterium]
MTALQKRLEELGKCFNTELSLLTTPCASPGYHTKIADGTPVHSTRLALDYALLLLEDGSPANVDRAIAVISAVLKLQDSDPCSKTFGIWPWYADEPLDKMSPPDWNWADFCGAVIAEILVTHADKLPTILVANMKDSLLDAALSIFRRNVGPDYTNIAIMGAGVCIIAGQILQDKLLMRYGKRRLERFIDYTTAQGGFNEYNSPTYTVVVIDEAERILRLATDSEARKLAETIFNLAWKVVAEHFHPATGQWAGPHSRAYADTLSQNTAAKIACATGFSVGSITPEEAEQLLVVKPLPCPDDLKESFNPHTPKVETVVRRFRLGNTYATSVIGTTWFNHDICLGTVNHDNAWTQRHPVIAYWPSAQKAVSAVLRVRFLHDGRDFASAFFRTVQKDNVALTGVTFLTNKGDFHDHLDHPQDGIFTASDFRLRVELTAPDAQLIGNQGIDCGLRSGRRYANIHCLDGFFNGRPVHWDSGQADGTAYIDAICYKGTPTRFDFNHLKDSWLFIALELLHAGEAPLGHEPDVHPKDSPTVAWAEWTPYGLQAAVSKQACSIGDAFVIGA